jgi:GNAT superfamily N-acetyltransferase
MIYFVQLPEQKREIATSILHALPDWFGIPESTQKYIDECSEKPFWSYRNGEQDIGFIALKETGPKAAEIFVMGVLKEYHRQGIGRMLFDAFCDYVKSAGYEFLQVKTVDAGCYEEYDRTRMFYERMGFTKLEVLPTLWDKWNPCLVMTMSLR